MITKDACSEKRLAYIARRVRFLQELQRFGVISIGSVPGKANPADALTKFLHKTEYRDYMSRLYNASPSDI